MRHYSQTFNMKQKIQILIRILFVSFVLPLCSCSQESAHNNLKFVQGDRIFLISRSVDSISLDRKAFALRYFCRQYDEKKEKFYSAQIAILENPNDLSFLKIGQSVNDVPYFEPGTGMAPGINDMYDTIFISNIGHHYLIYENEKNKSVFFVSRSKDVLELEWKIAASFYEQRNIQFSELKLEYLYFVVFIDKNLNKIINEDELKIIKVKFN